MTKIMKGGVAYNSTANMVALTQAEYDQLSTAQKNNGNFYFIVDSDPSYFSAANIDYINTTSGLTATNVQSAVDEVAIGLNWQGAGDFTLSSSTAGLALTKDMTNIKEIYFGIYVNVGSIGTRIRKSLTIPVYELKNVGVFLDEMITETDRIYLQIAYADSTHLAISSVSLPSYSCGVKVYIR